MQKEQRYAKTDMKVSAAQKTSGSQILGVHLRAEKRRPVLQNASKRKEQRNLPAFLQTNVTFYLICHEGFTNVPGPSVRMKEASEVQVPPQAAGPT